MDFFLLLNDCLVFLLLLFHFHSPPCHRCKQVPVATQQVSNASNKISWYQTPTSQPRTPARVKRREGYFEEPPHPEAWKGIKNFARCCSGILFDFQSYIPRIQLFFSHFSPTFRKTRSPGQLLWRWRVCWSMQSIATTLRRKRESSSSGAICCQCLSATAPQGNGLWRVWLRISQNYTA